jgi:hypothetical protein
MRAYQFAFAAVLLSGSAASATDACTGGPKNQWKSVDQVKAAAADHGYTKVVKVIIEDGCYEAVTLNPDGKIVGVQFDPVTLKLGKIEDPR